MDIAGFVIALVALVLSLGAGASIAELKKKLGG